MLIMIWQCNMQKKIIHQHIEAMVGHQALVKHQCSDSPLPY